MSAKNRTLVYAVVAVVVAAVIIGAAVTYNPSIMSPGQQTSSGSTSQTSQGSQSTQNTSTQSSGSSTSVSGATGTLNIYLTDAPPSNRTLKYLLVNVSSIELRYAGNLSTTTSSTSSASSSSSTSSTSSTSTSTTSTSVTTHTTTSTTTTPQNVFIFNVPSNVGRNVNLTSLQGQSLLLGTTKMPAGNITSIVINITGAKAFYTDKTSEQLKVVADGKLMVPIHFGVQANGSTNLTIDITPSLVHISQGGVLTPVIHVTAVEKGANNSTTTHTTEVSESTTTSTTSSTTTTSTTTTSS